MSPPIVGAAAAATGEARVVLLAFWSVLAYDLVARRRRDDRWNG